jgi:hypothetical protein
MKLRSIFVCTATWLVLGTVSAAPATDATIEKLLQVTHAEFMISDMNAHMEQWLRKTMTDVSAEEKFSPEQMRVLDQYVIKAAALLQEESNWSRMKPQIIQIYREVFTQKELEDQLAFYRSPAGQALIEKMPQVMQKSMALAQRQLGVLMPKLQAVLEEAVAEAKAVPAKTAPNPDSSPE